MKVSFQSLFLIIIIVFFTSSCSLFDKKEQAPSYLIIDSVGINPNYAEYGTSSHNISDVWVYANDLLIGCFELPAKIPILAEGNVKITALAGVKVDGISATRATYPFYASAVFNCNLSPEAPVRIKPIFNFDISTQIAFSEDFESAGILFGKAINSDTTITATNNPLDIFVNQQDNSEVNNYSGVINLNNEKDTFEIETINGYVLPKNGTYVFLEMNYKCTTPIIVGTKAIYSSTINRNPKIVLNPTNTWKKVYVNLTVSVSSEINASNFKIFFAGISNSGSTEDKVLLDNIKLIHARTAKH